MTSLQLFLVEFFQARWLLFLIIAIGHLPFKEQTRTVAVVYACEANTTVPAVASDSNEIPTYNDKSYQRGELVGAMRCKM